MLYLFRQYICWSLCKHIFYISLLFLLLHFLAHFNTILFAIYICSQENRGDLHRKGDEIHIFIISTVFSLLVIGFKIKNQRMKIIQNGHTGRILILMFLFWGVRVYVNLTENLHIKWLFACINKRLNVCTRL